VREPVEGLDLKGTRACAAFNLRKTSRAVTQLYDAGLAKVGLRSTQFTILVAAARAEIATVGALAALTLMDATTMTRNLRLMQRDGFIEVSRRGARREKRVRLTAKGWRALARATPVWREVQARFIGQFGERKWYEIQRQLGLLAALAARPAAQFENKGRD
jgi:DNA-binding MarR family transcriptional regulator